MIMGTSLITVALILLLYPVLTRRTYPLNGKRIFNENINRKKDKIIKKIKKRKMKRMGLEPKRDESEALVVMKSKRWPFVRCRCSVRFVDRWGTKNTLRRRLKRWSMSRNTKVAGRIVLCLALVALIYHVTGNLLSVGLLGAAYSSSGSGDWDNAATWGGAGFPVSGDTGQINNTHVVRVDAGTGNERCLSCDIQIGGELVIDSEGGGALSLTFDDAAGCGFTNNDGLLTIVGTAGNLVTITSASGAGYANSWDFSTNNMSITADYGVFEYYNNGRAGGTLDIDHCTFQHSDTNGFVINAGATLTSFDNNTIDDPDATGFYSNIEITATPINNLVITNIPGGQVDIVACNDVEFTNSNFDETNVGFVGSNHYVSSDTHNDVANSYYLIVSTGSVNKSDITNDFVGTDNVVLQTNYESAASKLVCDEAVAHNNLTIKNLCELEVNAGQSWTITQNATVTVENGGTLDLNGTVASRIVIRSSNPGTAWNLTVNATGTATVTGVDVQDSDASGGQTINASDGTNLDSSRNVNWNFGGVGGQKSYNLGFTVIVSKSSS